MNLAGVKVDEKFNDKYFARPAAAKKSAEFVASAEKVCCSSEPLVRCVRSPPVPLLCGEQKAKTVDAARVADQKAVDEKLVAAIKATPLLHEYIRSNFSLKSGEFPHALKF